MTYALGTAVTSVVGTKGAGTLTVVGTKGAGMLTKGPATSAKAEAATVKAGAKKAVEYVGI